MHRKFRENWMNIKDVGTDLRCKGQMVAPLWNCPLTMTLYMYIAKTCILQNSYKLEMNLSFSFQARYSHARHTKLRCVGHHPTVLPMHHNTILCMNAQIKTQCT